MKDDARQASAYDGAYQLHTDAIDDLVHASPENTPVYSKEELEKYRSSRRSLRLPEVLKVLLIKFWFYGAVCFFVFMGLGLYLADRLDLFFVAAVIMGMVNDLLINHFLRFAEKTPNGNNRWMMVNRRGAVGFFLNLLYAGWLLFLIVTLYSVVNAALLMLGWGYLGVEPIGFGLFAVMADWLCLSCKGLLYRIAADARQKTGGK